MRPKTYKGAVILPKIYFFLLSTFWAYASFSVFLQSHSIMNGLKNILFNYLYKYYYEEKLAFLGCARHCHERERTEAEDVARP